jgi:hypothetical protein
MIFMKARPVEVNLPSPRKAQLREIASSQGLTMSAFMARLFYLWERNPTAYEKLYHDTIKKTENTQGAS